MQSRRIVILVVSVVLGMIAALAAFSYLRGTQERANKGARLVQVYVVAKDIPKGLPGERAIAEQFIKRDSINAKYRPSTAVVQPDSLKNKVALIAISANQVLVDGQFVDPKVAQVTNSQRVELGRVAVSVNVDGVRAVGGLLVPGDRVNIMSRANVTAPATGRSVGDPVAQGDPNLAYTLLYQNVEILFIGAAAAPQPGETQAAASPGGGIITFSVPQEAAFRITLASQSDAGLYLTLVPPNNPAVSVPPVRLGNLFGAPCESLGGDNQPGTPDDIPVGCVPLSPYPVTTTTTTTSPAAP